MVVEGEGEAVVVFPVSLTAPFCFVWGGSCDRVSVVSVISLNLCGCEFGVYAGRWIEASMRVVFYFSR